MTRTSKKHHSRSKPHEPAVEAAGSRLKLLADDAGGGKPTYQRSRCDLGVWGKALRDRCPREGHAGFAPPPRGAAIRSTR